VIPSNQPALPFEQAGYRQVSSREIASAALGYRSVEVARANPASVLRGALQRYTVRVLSALNVVARGESNQPTPWISVQPSGARPHQQLLADCLNLLSVMAEKDTLPRSRRRVGRSVPEHIACHKISKLHFD